MTPAEAREAIRRGEAARRTKAWTPSAALAEAKGIVAALRAAGGAPLAEALAWQGRVARDLQEGSVEALACYREAAAILGELGDTYREAHMVRHIGELMREAGDPVGGEAHNLKALALYGEGAAPLDIGNTWRGVAVAREAQGLDQPAADAWLEAKRWYLAADADVKRMTGGDNPGVAEADDRIARLAGRIRSPH